MKICDRLRQWWQTFWAYTADEEPARWEVLPAIAVTAGEFTPVGSTIGYQVRWSEPDKEGRYLWVGHYFAGQDTSLHWCRHAAERHAERLTYQGKTIDNYHHLR